MISVLMLMKNYESKLVLITKSSATQNDNNTTQNFCKSKKFLNNEKKIKHALH